MERQMAFVLRLFGAYAMLSGALHSATGAIVVFTVEQAVNSGRLHSATGAIVERVRRDGGGKMSEARQGEPEGGQH